MEYENYLSIRLSRRDCHWRLGVGGFGCVYKANFDGGFAAAVKRLGSETQNCDKEFEVMIIDCLLKIYRNCPFKLLCLDCHY